MVPWFMLDYNGRVFRELVHTDVRQLIVRHNMGSSVVQQHQNAFPILSHSLREVQKPSTKHRHHHLSLARAHILVVCRALLKPAGATKRTKDHERQLVCP